MSEYKRSDGDRQTGIINPLLNPKIHPAHPSNPQNPAHFSIEGIIGLPDKYDIEFE